MIPLKLTLSNFLSYGDNSQTIDFARYPLICLSGKNGNGKSGMLDAITWALWGDARKISGSAKPDLGLLRLGQSHMMVVLDFEFNSNIYRIRREFSKSYGKHFANLDFEIFDDIKQAFISLTDKTIRATQAKINHLLGLDFETFVNSAFLRQGQSNEFSKKSPKERKQIISSILGLSKFDLLKSKALEHVKKYNDEKNLLLKLQEHVSLEFSKKNELLSGLSIVESKLQELTLKISELENHNQVLEKKWLENKEQIRVLDLLKQEKNNLKKSYDEELLSLKAIFNYWREVHRTFLRIPNVGEIEENLSLKTKEEEKYRNLQQRSLELQEIILKQKEQLNSISLAKKEESHKNLYSLKRSLDILNLDSKNMESNIKDKLNAVASLKAKKEEGKLLVSNLEKLKSEHLVFLENLSKLTSNFEKRRTYYQTLIQRGNWVNSELAELKLKKSKLNEIDDPCCPLCEQVLTIKRKQFLSKKFINEEKFLLHRYSRISKIIIKLKQILLDQNEEIKALQSKNELFKEQILKLEDHEKTLIIYDKEIEVLEKEISELSLLLVILEDKIQDKLKLIKKEEESATGMLLNDPIIVENVKILESLVKERENLNYNQAYHNKIKEEISLVRAQLKELEELQKAFNEQNIRKEKISLKIKHLKEVKKNLLEYSSRVEGLTLFNEKLARIEQERNSLKALNNDLFTKKQELLKEIIDIKNQLSTIDKLTKEYKIRADKINHIEKEVSQYQALAYAFGKDGIQALLIEEAIPEIEQEANFILSKITDNKSQIFIESLRDLKKGGVKETLDIQISDSTGIRPYEMFSGGEAFRIDFSLRIAISKLLARRAGTALQTLIIDEGFGSQDEDGLSYLMDAIYAIQKDFSKIIVVSHLPIFKDNFPVHFIIEKSPSGSIVQVLERG